MSMLLLKYGGKIQNSAEAHVSYAYFDGTSIFRTLQNHRSNEIGVRFNFQANSSRGKWTLPY